MVDVEHFGRAAPSPVKVRLTKQEIKILQRMTEERAEFRGYARSDSRWKRGLVGTNKAILSGMTGQYALAKYLRVNSDESSKVQGDGGVDLDAKGLTIQVKTRLNSRHGNLVRRTTHAKKMCGLKSEVVAFCQLEGEATVLLLGWLRRKDCRKFATFKKSPIAESKHWNMVIADANLLPISQLREEISLR